MSAVRRKNRHLGLLPRMDARRRANGGYTYRYLTHDRKYINLGHDRIEAIKQVLEFERRAPDTGTVSELLREYFKSTNFNNDISPRTQSDYLGYSKQIIRVFGTMPAEGVIPPHIARYLRVERASAPSQANKEISMLSSAYQFGIETGLVTKNPCREVRKNKERPRSRCPSWEEIISLYEIAKNKGPSSHLVGLMAIFAALTGRRRAEFIRMRKDDLTEKGIMITYSKGRVDDAEKMGLILWTDSLRDVFDELQTIERVPSPYVWSTIKGSSYTESGFKTMWSKIMTDWTKVGGKRFTFHDLRAYYITSMVEQNKNPETHSNPATTKRVYDRRRVVKIKTSS